MPCFCLYFSLFTAFLPAAVILPQLLLRHHPPQQIAVTLAPKCPFLAFCRRRSSPFIADFSQMGRLKLTSLQHFSPIALFLSEANACGVTEGDLSFCFKLSTKDYGLSTASAQSAVIETEGNALAPICL